MGGPFRLVGRAPVLVMVAVGEPAVVTVNEPATPTFNVVMLALVLNGAWPTVRVKFWVTSGETPLAAVKVKE